MRFFERVYTLVRCIPAGRVASYGQIARLLGQPHGARTVGWALRGVPEGSDVPWHRVVNAAGRISLADPQSATEQKRLLEIEGVVLGPDGRLDMACFGWGGLPWPEVQALLAGADNGADCATSE
jgi:methylated-DNA-protein-cysteine methyltransferase-like protein